MPFEMVKYTETELLDELRAVGFLHEDELISPRDIAILRKLIDDELDSTQEDGMFSSLAVDERYLDSEDGVGTPIQIRSHPEKGRNQSKLLSPIDLPLSWDNSDNEVPLDKEIDDELSNAFETLAKALNTTSKYDEFYYTESSSENDKENEKQPVASDDSKSDGKSDFKTPMQPVKPIKPCDLGLRPVLLPSPGRLKYRNDPVCLRKIYEEEWKLHPEPGEKKRLSLRWKIREFMLRRDMSSLPIRKIKDRSVKAHHTKLWSPAPYLD
ncbi:hypothetical protein WR25_08885 [Diploscapter pachys]|uniref:Centriolar and ciliogenesis-associated protein HYLS1 C-terminal domain-containing protein n=1 Tax=Diploscapter pachys TaxID=2018661 RepID=A0A2A2JAY2_9BILA|nr:hypothetical protein WR25_08885 [Diploscapter pachys]